MKTYHLICGQDDWELSEEGNRTPLRTFPTKERAIEGSAELLGQLGGSLRIHRTDGTIEEERTYPRAADPASSPG